MSKYNKFNWISSESLLAKIQEELKSYFATGQLDDSLFYTYVKYCIDKLGAAAKEIRYAVITINNYKAPLPKDLVMIKDVFVCAPMEAPMSVTAPGQVIELVTKEYEIDCPDVCGYEPYQNTITVMSKTNATLRNRYKFITRLKPGNVTSKKYCNEEFFENPFDSLYSFDIEHIGSLKNLSTNLDEATVMVIYYGDNKDEYGLPMYPDIVEIEDYIEHFIKFKIFEFLMNQTADESFQILQSKMQFYKSLADSKYIIAHTWLRSPSNDQYKDMRRRSAYRVRRNFNIR